MILQASILPPSLGTPRTSSFAWRSAFVAFVRSLILSFTRASRCVAPVIITRANYGNYFLVKRAIRSTTEIYYKWERKRKRIDFCSRGKFAASTRRSRSKNAHLVFSLISGASILGSEYARAGEEILFCEYFILASDNSLYLLYFSVYLTSQLPFACSHH